jgi:hypothetical protein
VKASSLSAAFPKRKLPTIRLSLID